VENVRKPGEQRHIDVAAEAKLFLGAANRIHILLQELLVELQSVRLAFGRQPMNEEIDSAAQDLLPDDFANLFLEGEIFTRHPQLEVEVPMIQAADLNVDFGA